MKCCSFTQRDPYFKFTRIILIFLFILLLLIVFHSIFVFKTKAKYVSYEIRMITENNIYIWKNIKNIKQCKNYIIFTDPTTKQKITISNHNIIIKEINKYE